MRHPARIAFVVAVAAFLSACSAQAETVPPTSTSAPRSTSTGVPAQESPLPPDMPPDAIPPAHETTSLPPAPFDPVGTAVGALAAELGVPVETIQLIEAVPVQWSDTSLGCPQPGMAYAAVVMPGYLVRLAAGGETYAVHTDLAGMAIVCRDGQSAAGTASDPIAAEFVVQARADLAEQLGLPPEQVVLVTSEMVEWSDASLGCPRQGEVYAQVVTPGYRIIFGVGDARYEYHTDTQRMIACDAPTE